MQNLILLPASAMPALEAATTLGGSTGPDLSRYFLVCSLLVVMTVGVAWGLRKMVAGNVKFRASQRSLKVVDVLAMGGRRKLAVVRCYDRTFVLGLGEKEITPIAELDAVIGSEEAAPVERKSDQAAFAAALEQIRKVMPKKTVPTPQVQVEDIVAPALTRKLAKRKVQSTAPAAPVVAPIAAQAPVPVELKPQRKVVRRKVARRRESDPLARQREAQAVASAAMEIVAEKRKAQVAAQPKAAPQATVQVAAPVAPKKAAPKTLPRLEGILG